MKFVHKRKKSSAATINKNLSKIKDGDIWVYGTGKLPMDEYLGINALSSHFIKDLASPNMSDLHIWRKHFKKDLPEKPSNSFTLGRAFHTATLEPHLYADEYAVAPKVDRRTKQGKADWADFVELNGHKQLLTFEEDDTAIAMSNVVRKNKYAKAVMHGCHAEVSGFAKGPSSTWLKGRADLIHFDAKYGIDLKSVDDVSPAGFARACANFRYDIQAYTYKHLFGLDEFIFLCCSKADPYEVAVYQLNDEFMEKAECDFYLAIERYEKIIASDLHESFTNRDNPLTILAPPNWFLYL